MARTKMNYWSTLSPVLAQTFQKSFETHFWIRLETLFLPLSQGKKVENFVTKFYLKGYTSI